MERHIGRRSVSASAALRLSTHKRWCASSLLSSACMARWTSEAARVLLHQAGGDVLKATLPQAGGGVGDVTWQPAHTVQGSQGVCVCMHVVVVCASIWPSGGVFPCSRAGGVCCGTGVPVGQSAHRRRYTSVGTSAVCERLSNPTHTLPNSNPSHVYSHPAQLQPFTRLLTPCPTPTLHMSTHTLSHSNPSHVYSHPAQLQPFTCLLTPCPTPTLYVYSHPVYVV